ncbi:MAG TPA: 2-amino-4-hydroxy-6-hydroxymethyldihydropteridine diphosphokinase [Caulobacteraceae bacterium]|jgi:2-amino-4-hydroxy-6-hydroxymethyldihydropteridine diphosphokinase|nr:2-amino-4-hydroxy-6-hydroxymethyldihydropteridine diphosphokinase [Caulobacteraceae bacterium]
MDARDPLPALDEAVIIALGSNLAGGYRSPEALLEAAIARFPREGATVRARSPLWRSAAWPDPTQPAFVNAVAIIETQLSPQALMAALRILEREFGRRPGPPNGPRTLDLDLIAHGRSVVDGADLVLPHPRAHERLFVMGPLAQIAPAWRHPLNGKTAADLAAAATVGVDGRPDPPGHAALHNGAANAI